MKKNDPEPELMKKIEKEFVRNPLQSESAIQYHELVIETETFERAEGIFQDALDKHPDDKRLKYLLIDVCLRQNKNERAMAEIESAIDRFGFDDGILGPALTVRDRLGPMDNISSGNLPDTVSLCMIVKNEQEHLARCLASVKPVVHEMIVVDTGSRDKTREIARIFGARVYEFDWSDDFSAARNHAISKARGTWIFILDADEVISEKDYDGFARLVEKSTEMQAAYSIVTRNYTYLSNMVGWQPNDGLYPDQEAGIGWFPSTKVRLFHRQERLRFKGRVHEMVEPALKSEGLDIQLCDLVVHHYGKLTEEKAAEKEALYYQLGKKKLGRKTDDISAVREIAIQAGQLEKWDEAIDLWNRVLDMDSNFGEVHINLASIYWNLADYQKSLEHARKSVEMVPRVKEARFNLAVSYIMLHRTDEAVGILSGLAEEFPAYQPVKFMLAAAQAIRGRTARAEKEYRALLETPMGPGLAFAVLDFVERLLSDNRFEDAVKLIRTAGNVEISLPQLEKILLKCEQALPDAPFPSPVITVSIECGKQTLKVKIPENETFRIKNIFERQEYAILPFRSHSGPMIGFDVGANVGLFTIYMKQLDPGCRVYGFEPCPDTHQLLMENTRNLDNVVIYAFGLYNQDRDMMLNTHRFNTGEHSIKLKNRFFKDSSRVTVKDTAAQFDQLGIKHLDVLKIDTEGCEVEILESLGRRLDLVDYVLVEYHSEADRRKIDRLLEGFHAYSLKADSPGVGIMKYIREDLLHKGLKQNMK